MKNKGFTLVEVLAVVAILAILAMLLVPKATSIIKSNKERSCNAIVSSIISAADEYMYKHIGQIDNDINTNGYSEISIGTLKEDGLLDRKLVNPLTDTEFSNSQVVRITKDRYVYNSTYMGDDCK